MFSSVGHELEYEIGEDDDIMNASDTHTLESINPYASIQRFLADIQNLFKLKIFDQEIYQLRLVLTPESGRVRVMVFHQYMTDRNWEEVKGIMKEIDEGSLLAKFKCQFTTRDK